jgi:hypothetical protein
VRGLLDLVIFPLVISVIADSNSVDFSNYYSV